MLALKAAFTRFLDTLAFFTCLVPARMYQGTPFREYLPWFAASGLAVGAVAATAAWCGTFLTTGLDPVLGALAGGFIWVTAEVLVSRGLHWDGLSDLSDALGSAREGDAFWSVMKDSRLGTFGALALFLVGTGQILSVSGHLSQGNWLLLCAAPAWSRGIAVLPLVTVPAHDPRSLGGKFATDAGIMRSLGLLAEALFLAILLFLSARSLFRLFLFLVIETGVILWIRAKARRHGGISGDFVGATIELSQLVFLLAC